MHGWRLSRRRLGAAAWVAAAGSHGGRCLPFARAQIEARGLPGRVILPDDPAYAAARLTFNGRISRFPAAIAVCSTPEEVGKAIRWARKHSVPIRVRSGGHSYEGFSVADGALVIDLAGTAGVAIDAAGGTATVGAGTRLGEVVAALAPHGLALPAGTCPGVGFGGLALGGGIGYLSRWLGLTSDNVVAIDAVDADGRRVRASERDDPDLYWAMRGGGGAVAIAVAFTLRTTPLPVVAVCDIAWPFADAAAVVDAWQRWAPFADRRLAVSLALPGRGAGMVSAAGVFAGPEADLPGLLAPLLSVGTPAAVRTETLPFADAAARSGGAPIERAWFKNASGMVPAPLDAAGIGALLGHVVAAPPGQQLVGLFPLGGAVGDVDPGATVFPHRRALFDMQYQSYWWDGEDGAAGTAWVRAIRDAMRPWTAGAYANYADADLADWADAYYGSNLPRLRAVKAAWDPEGVFAGPQVVRPG